MSTPLNTALESYQATLECLDEADATIDVEQVLAILNARDTVQVALKQQSPVPNSQLQTVIALDARLREKVDVIAKAVNYKTAEQFSQWRESVHPDADAWWWRLERIAPPHPWDQLDWLWRSVTVVGWTANLSLLVNIAGRFFSQGAGLAGAAAVIFPSILAVLQAKSELTKSGNEGFDQLLTKLRIPLHWREEARAGSTLLLSVFLGYFWLLLPDISRIYTNTGWENYDKGQVGAAEQEYMRAIALDADNVNAHYNLGLVYEDLQEFDQARKHYQIAARGDMPAAYNKLGRLYLKRRKYPEAAALLQKGLLLTEDQETSLDVRYNLLKNMGWTRFLQGRHEEAEYTLLAAVGITKNPAASEVIENKGAAHCVLAQALDKQDKPSALEAYKICCQQGNRLNSDEDTWLHLAHTKLNKAGESCPNPGN